MGGAHSPYAARKWACERVTVKANTYYHPENQGPHREGNSSKPGSQQRLITN